MTINKNIKWKNYHFIISQVLKRALLHVMLRLVRYNNNNNKIFYLKTSNETAYIYAIFCLCCC